MTPTLAILALDKWSRECPRFDETGAWDSITEVRVFSVQFNHVIFQLFYPNIIKLNLKHPVIGGEKGFMAREDQRGTGCNMCRLNISTCSGIYWSPGCSLKVYKFTF